MPPGSLPDTPSVLVLAVVAVLLVALLVLTGCAREHSWQDVVDGRVEGGSLEVAAAERAAVDELLRSSAIPPEAVRVLDGEERAQGTRFVRVENGALTVLALDGLSASPRVEGLAQLEDLRLEGAFADAAVRDLPALTSLLLVGQSEATADEGEEVLRRIELRGLTALTDVVLAGGLLADGALEALDLTSCEVLRSVDLSRLGLRRLPPLPPSVESLSVPSNRIAPRELERLAALPGLTRLSLEDNDLESLDSLPPLPALRHLRVGGNPLPAELALRAEDYPSLRSLDVRRTAVRTVPRGLAALEGLELRLDREVEAERDFVATLERLRASHAAAGERVTELTTRSGRIEGRSGRCSWQTSTHSPAEVTCALTFERLTGRADARLGTTDLTMPFSGGGDPTVRATLRVGRGTAAVYFRETYDLVELAVQITDFDPAEAEAFRRPEDRFDGYRRHVATPGDPAVGTGRPTLLGARVLLWIEALDGPAEDLALDIEPS